jgi:glycolate dehydrogenase FAD-linked subunit
MSTEEIIEAITRAAGQNQPVTIRSSASDVKGNVTVISTAALTSLRLNPATATVTAGSGVETAVLNAEVERAGFRVVGVPKAPKARHVGSLIATGEVSRRGLCGIRVVLPTGEQVGVGGNIQKDVTGYDLCGFFLGSMGRTGVITEATFRLSPKDVEIPVAPGRGEAAISVGPNLAGAFDPDGVLSRG